MREIKGIVIHCSASPDSRDLGFKEINEWHKANGWKSPSGIHCGYHYIVRRNGTIERGRPDSEVGSHVAGKNSKTLGIVWIGENQPTAVQMAALIQITHALMVKYNVPIDKVQGHREIAPESKKACPVIDMDKLRAEIIFKQKQVNVRRD
jgi:N-acetyl-anhydromuramyl-L-alanine amidase AmpD